MPLSPTALRAVRADERAQLLDTLTTLGPDAPTLCAPWRASTLASHLVVSELGAGLPWAVGWPLRRLVGAERATAAVQRMQPVMLRSMRWAERRGWPWLLAKLRAGPPRLLRRGTLSTVRLLEDWIHHEDLRRANDLPPRTASTALDAALTAGLELLASMPEFADRRAQIALRLPDGTVINDLASPRLTVSGPPGEVLLALAGRDHVAQVDLAGDTSVLGTALAF